jgi:6-phosphogluconolactonase
MMKRRKFIGMLAVLILVFGTIAWVLGCANTGKERLADARKQGKTVLYRSVGERIDYFDVDVEAATLTMRGSASAPSNVQYAWPHPSKRYFYVASSNRGPAVPGGSKEELNSMTAFRVDTATGALQSHGKPQELPSRPIYMTVDGTGNFALAAANIPPIVTVLRINPDGTIGAEVKQPAPLDLGVYPHSLRITPNNRAVIVAARGNVPTPKTPEDPGAIKVFRFNDGVLSNLSSIAPGGGIGFRPRHMDFHPQKPWLYVTREAENKLDVYRLEGDNVSATRLFVKDTLGEPNNIRGNQAAADIHMHPNGRFLYVNNRADENVKFEGKDVFKGGENTISVYAIDQNTGEPTMIQSIESRGIAVRTFALDPSGRILVAETPAPRDIREGSRIATVPACLSVFRVGSNGKLDFVRKYDVEISGIQIIDGKASGGKTQWWVGMMGLPG